MKALILSSLFVLGWNALFSQVDKKFPELVGQTVNGKTMSFPEVAKGKYTLMGMAWSKKAEPAFDSWVSPVYNKFIAKTGMMDDMYDVNVYFVPMFTGVKKGAMDGMMEKMKARSSEEIIPFVVFYKGDIKPYEESLKLTNKEFPYIFLLNPDGVVVWKTRGRFSDDKMLEIEGKILGE